MATHVVILSSVCPGGRNQPNLSHPLQSLMPTMGGVCPRLSPKLVLAWIVLQLPLPRRWKERFKSGTLGPQGWYHPFDTKWYVSPRLAQLMKVGCTWRGTCPNP